MLGVEGVGKSRSCAGSTLGAVIWRHVLVEGTANLALQNRCELTSRVPMGSGLCRYCAVWGELCLVFGMTDWMFASLPSPVVLSECIVRIAMS